MLSYSVLEVNIKAILPDKVEHNVSTNICFKLGKILDMRTSTHFVAKLWESGKILPRFREKEIGYLSTVLAVNELSFVSFSYIITSVLHMACKCVHCVKL